MLEISLNVSISPAKGTRLEGSDLDYSNFELGSDSGLDGSPNIFDARPLPRLFNRYTRNDSTSLRSAIHDAVISTNVQEKKPHIFLKSCDLPIDLSVV